MAQMAQEVLRIDECEVWLTRKNIKNMYLRYQDGRICVNAPVRVKKEQVEAFVRDHREWIENAKLRWEEKQAKKETEVERTKEEIWRDWTALKENLMELIAYWAPRMGVRPNGFKIRSMKTRWGSCNVKTHHMTFNMELAYVPHDCLEYVVVHELSHLIEPSHNERFWRTMEQYLPDARERRKKLKGYSI